ncbi:MAG: NfeD family protein [Lachnospiraceae bacterium]|uniref:NfeD family protein n=1 Tax=Parablautia sp. Marseille-Q6255 TaxID=3039593 RepID=UPI0024BC92A0|nr:NfeD family protein [Parablautia sp. Marseille-Q6255]
MEAVQLLGIILLIAGFVLVGIEMVLPGFSVPGISGIVCFVAGVFIIADSVMEAAVITIAILAVLGIMMAVILHLLSRGKLKTPIVLEEEQRSTEGYISSGDLKYLLGKQGTAATDLRPAGIGKFDGVNFDVMSEGNYISKGTEIEIIKVEGSKLVVKQRRGEEYE